MLMKPIKYLLSILIVLCFQGCPGRYSEEPDMQFTIKNKSNEDIYFYANCEDSIINIKDLSKGYLIFLEKNNDYKIDFWIKLFQPNRKLNIFFLKKTILDAYSWQEIQEKNIFDRQYVLTLEELKSMNYEIIYDGK